MNIIDGVTMPNWSRNTVTVRGEPEMIDEVQRIKFDFNMILPPPQALVDDCEAYCAKCKSRVRVDKSDYCTKCNIRDNIGGRVSSWEKGKKRYRQLNKDEIKLAKSWVKKYGTDSWYDWNTSNWGTKWNAGEVKMKRVDKNTLTARFDTAWAPPSPIFDKLAGKYNVMVEVSAEIEGDDELWKEVYGKEV